MLIHDILGINVSKHINYLSAMAMILTLPMTDNMYGKCAKIEYKVAGKIVDESGAMIAEARIYFFFNDDKHEPNYYSDSICQTNKEGLFDCKKIFNTYVPNSVKVFKINGKDVPGEDCSAGPQKAEIIIMKNDYRVRRELKNITGPREK